MNDPSTLIQLHLDRALTDQEAAELNAWVKESPENARRFALEATIHSQLRDVVSGERDLRAALDIPAIAGTIGAEGRSDSLTSKVFPWRTVWRIAAMVVVAGFVAAGIWAWRAAQPLGTLVAVSDAQWDAAHAGLKPGSMLRPGSLRLEKGVAHVILKNGVSLILQAPTDVDLNSAMDATMNQGRLTAHVPKEAIGFTIATRNGKVVDLGTEFGVDLPQTGDSLVHVFEGKVLVDTAMDGRSTNPLQYLTERMGARIDGRTGALQLVAGSADGFIRSMDEAQQPNHVVAYWRFEDHPIGHMVPHTSGNRETVRGTIDSSRNGNDLFSYSRDSQPQFSADVATPLVTETGQLNVACLDNTIPPSAPDIASRDVYTMSKFTHASPTDIQAITPLQWTIEASVKLKVNNPHPGEFHTFVARDGEGADMTTPDRAPLYFQVTDQGRFAIKFGDTEHRFHEAVADDLNIQVNHWYHLAAVSDGKKLSLYIDARDGRGYVLHRQTVLPANGSTALAKTSNDFSWVVGRAFYKGRAVDWFQGWIDEVRICDVAVDPAHFLFAAPPPAQHPNSLVDRL
jgi:ferric-dicitrate binding protein FerR (iron transport regulator)